MTGAGAPGAAGIFKCLVQDEHINIVGADANENAVGRYLVGEFETIPRADAEGFIDSLLSICRRRSIHALLPLVTRELIPLSNRMDDFAAIGTRVLTMPVEVLQIANDKSRLYEFLNELGIALPAFRIVRTVDDFEKAVAWLGYPAKPVCFKPSRSNGSRGFRIISKNIDAAQLLFEEKPNSTFMTYEDAIRILQLKPFPELLVSAFLPGDEFSVDCLADDGKAVLVVPRLREKMINGISVEGRFVNDTVIIDYCRLIIDALGLDGNVGIQLRRDEEGRPLLLEINPRLQGTTSACLGAGINLPLLGIRQALGMPILPEELQVKWGTRFSRYWNEVFH